MNLRKTIRIVLMEEEIFPIHVRRRIKYDENDTINYLKKFALRNSGQNKKIDVLVSMACRDTAYELIDSTQLPLEDGSFSNIEDMLTKYLKEKYGKKIKEFLEDFYMDGGDELGSRYVFEKHSERHGGSGFSEGYETWNLLLKHYASWFPDLDWKELKTKLDSMGSGGKILIKKPGDINNTMNYYFSLQRFDVPNKRIKESFLKEEASEDTKYAVIEILKPSSRMSQKWYFQAVPLNKTEHDKIYIKRGPAGILTISTKNIKIHKIFKKSEKEEMDKYLEKLRDNDIKKGEQKEGEITERCWKGYTQKGMKTMFGKRYPNCVKKKK